MAFSDYQYEIYFQGLGGARPEYPLTFADLEAKAEEVLPPESFGYVVGGAGSEDTVRANRDAFKRWRIVPRMLQGIGDRDLSVEILGHRLDAPLFLAPVGVQGIVHDDAEVAVARAARSLGIPFVLSTVSSKTLEEVADAAGDGMRWFQLYWPNDPELAASLVSRAEVAGYGAIVVTLDTMFLAWRPRDLQNAFLPFLKAEGLANYLSDPVFTKGLEMPPDDPTAAVMKWAQVFSNAPATWRDLAGLREATSLPILVKGVVHPEDARAALDAGVDGIIVSNHGGRQVDGAISTLDALPGVVEAAGGRVPVLFDSGIRSGADVVKAVALGADAALIGRAYIWGLAVGGEEGVKQVLRAMLAEIDLTVALTGFTELSKIDRSIFADS